MTGLPWFHIFRLTGLNIRPKYYLKAKNRAGVTTVEVMFVLEIRIVVGGLETSAWAVTRFSGKGLGSGQLWLTVIATGVLGLMTGEGCGIVIQLALSAAGVTGPLVYR